MITRRQFLAGLAALAVLAIPEPAEAMPAKFRKCGQVEQNGITYLLYRRCAIVRRCPARKSVTIPDRITHDGKRYTVAAIWPEAISSDTRRAVLKAKHLETIESPRIFSNRVLVICYSRDVYQWLRSAGANVRKHF